MLGLSMGSPFTEKGPPALNVYQTGKHSQKKEPGSKSLHTNLYPGPYMYPSPANTLYSQMEIEKKRPGAPAILYVSGIPMMIPKTTILSSTYARNRLCFWRVLWPLRVKKRLLCAFDLSKPMIIRKSDVEVDKGEVEHLYCLSESLIVEGKRRFRVSMCTSIARY